jgi:hypothetical protein
MVRPVLLALCAFLTTAVAVAAEDLTGSSWKNQRGSVLTIASIDKSGVFKGTFESKAAGFECEGKFDASGTIRKGHVVFYVTFKNAAQDCNMVTVWRGSVRGSRLSALWDIAFTNKKIGRLRFLKGSDIFKRM